MQEHLWMMIQSYTDMKVKTIRNIIFILTLIIAMASILLIMGLVFGMIEQLWLTWLVGANTVVLIINSSLLYALNNDKTWWEKKDELDRITETYRRNCIAYEKARDEFSKIQLHFHYKEASKEKS